MCGRDANLFRDTFTNPVGESKISVVRSFRLSCCWPRRTHLCDAARAVARAQLQHERKCADGIEVVEGRVQQEGKQLVRVAAAYLRRESGLNASAVRLLLRVGVRCGERE